MKIAIVLLLAAFAALLPAAWADGTGCSFSISREMTSSTWLATVTVALASTGGSGCNLRDVAFQEILPPEFGSPQNMSFSPAFPKVSNQTIIFAFSSFAPGEKKTLVYKAPHFVPNSALQEFGSGLVYPLSEENETSPSGIAPSVQTAADAGSAYEAAAVASGVGVFVILAAGIGVIYYLEKKKRVKAQN